MNDNDAPTYKPGDKVLYAGCFGHDGWTPGVIYGHGYKNGRLVYDVQLPGEDFRWGYENQFRPDNTH